MNTKIVATSGDDLFIVNFYHQTDNNFVCNAEGLLDVLKTKDRNGINYIKRLDRSKCKFERIGKTKLRQIVGWFTELDIYLDTHYYFKKKTKK